MIVDLTLVVFINKGIVVVNLATYGTAKYWPHSMHCNLNLEFYDRPVTWTWLLLPFRLYYFHITVLLLLKCFCFYILPKTITVVCNVIVHKRKLRYDIVSNVKVHITWSERWPVNRHCFTIRDFATFAEFVSAMFIILFRNIFIAENVYDIIKA